MLGNWKPKSSWHCLTTLYIATLLVLNSSIKKRSRTKSSDLRSDLFVGLLLTHTITQGYICFEWDANCKVVSSEADLPILPKMLLAVPCDCQCLFICWSAGLHKTLQADLGEIFREGWPKLQLIRFRWQTELPPGEHNGKIGIALAEVCGLWLPF